MTGDLYINKSKTSTSITVTRSNNQSLLFSKVMGDYQVFCELYLDNNAYFLNLKRLILH